MAGKSQKPVPPATPPPAPAPGDHEPLSLPPDEDALELPDEVEEALETMPVEERAVVERYLDNFRIQLRSGPLPDPATLKEYQEVSPDLVPWILKQAENQSDHRMAMERKELNGHNFRGWFYVVVAALVVLALAGAGTYLAILGKETVAVTIFATTLVGLAGAFLANRSLRKRE
ncbi:DUF2335 domain-containing protein [Neolewinella lacunae]|uniref:DUF2335 domain-containing protein n=1 Tax=Neolewinella lacunae TaxID=1517758 RepID=A0A923T9I1_9BACT|nr:DUF2335 domain-containing protein [Neolewinella lacunae]MBC6995544.1 DUF2335 domain-containing protein [Neolewinella lacunae]MDN3635580.1 DUF2335 domain-containing protein [Neolewinella lacunae]